MTLNLSRLQGPPIKKVQLCVLGLPSHTFLALSYHIVDWALRDLLTLGLKFYSQLSTTTPGFHTLISLPPSWSEITE